MKHKMRGFYIFFFPFFFITKKTRNHISPSAKDQTQDTGWKWKEVVMIRKTLQSSWAYFAHCFQNRTGPGGRTVKTGNRDENRFFKSKEPDFLLIPWIIKTGVGPLEPVRTVRSNPLAIKKKKKQLNTILFYLIKLSISYKE